MIPNKIHPKVGGITILLTQAGAFAGHRLSQGAALRLDLGSEGR